MEAKKKIGLLGEGWGAIAAFYSLSKAFCIEYLGSDPTIIDFISNKHYLVQSIKDFNCKIIICSGYKPIIKKDILDKHHIINIHYSLLPKYRGLHSTAWAILNGEKKLGLTIHLMNEFIDDGPIIHQEIFENDQVSSATYYMQLFNKFIENNLAEIVKNYIDGNIKPIEQNKADANWVGRRTDKHNIIDFHESHDIIKRLFRVLTPPYPYPKITYKKRTFTVKKVGFHFDKTSGDISRVLNIDADGVWIKSKDGFIILKEILNQSDQNVEFSNFKIGAYLND